MALINLCAETARSIQHFSSKLIFAAPSKISAGVGIDAAGGITSTDEDSVITISGQKLILSGQNFKIKAFAGYEAIPQPGRKLFSHTAIVGGACTFAW